MFISEVSPVPGTSGSIGVDQALEELRIRVAGEALLIGECRSPRVAERGITFGLTALSDGAEGITVIADGDDLAQVLREGTVLTISGRFQLDPASFKPTLVASDVRRTLGVEGPAARELAANLSSLMGEFPNRHRPPLNAEDLLFSEGIRRLVVIAGPRTDLRPFETLGVEVSIEKVDLSDPRAASPIAAVLASHSAEPATAVIFAADDFDWEETQSMNSVTTARAVAMSRAPVFTVLGSRTSHTLTDTFAAFAFARREDLIHAIRRASVRRLGHPDESGRSEWDIEFARLRAERDFQRRSRAATARAFALHRVEIRSRQMAAAWLVAAAVVGVGSVGALASDLVPKEVWWCGPAIAVALIVAAIYAWQGPGRAHRPLSTGTAEVPEELSENWFLALDAIQSPREFRRLLAGSRSSSAGARLKRN